MAVTINILTRFQDQELRRAEREFDRLVKRAALQQGSLQRRLLETGTRIRQLGDQMAAVGQKMTLGFTMPLAAGFGYAVKAASDLSESMNKVNVVFGKSAQAVQRWSKTTADRIGQSRAQALEAAGTFGNLFKTMGVGQADAAKMSMRLVELASDLASFNNIDPTEALDALRSGLVGEAEPMRRLGVLLSEAAVKAEAVRMGLVKEGDELTEQQKVAARYSLIMKQTTAAQGDFQRTGDSLANLLRRIRAIMDDLASQYGRVLLRYVRDAAKELARLLKWLGGLSPETRRLAIRLALVAAAAGPVLVVLGKLGGAVGLLMQGLGKLAAVHQASMVAPWARSIGPMRQVFGLMRAGVGPIKALQLTFGGLSVAALGWGAVIIGVIAGLVLLYTKCEWFRDAVHAVLGAIGKAFGWFAKAVGKVFGWIKRHWRGLLDAFLLATGPIGWIIAWVIHHWDKCKAALSRVFGAIRKAWNWLWDHFRKTPVGQIVMRVADAFGRLVGYVREHWQEIVRAVADAVNAIGRLINKAFGWTGIKVPTVSWGYSEGGSSRTGKTHGAVAARKGDPSDRARRPRTGDAADWVADKLTGAVDWLTASAGDIAGWLLSHLRLPRLPGPLARLLPALVARIAASLRRRLGSLAGAGKGAYGWAYALARRFGLTVTSTYRPGAVTAAGYRSDHAVYGRAADLAGPAANMAALWRYLVATAGSWKQAIYRHGILDSGHLGYYAPGDHFDHVHVARGGVGDYSGPAPRPALAAAAEQHVHVHVHLPGGTALVGEAERVGEVLAPHVARAIDRAERRRLRG